MKNLAGYGITGFILIIAVASVSGLVYAIQARANELIYYKELSKQRTQPNEIINYCGGRSSLECSSGYTCIVDEDSDKGIGRCVEVVN